MAQRCADLSFQIIITHPTRLRTRSRFSTVKLIICTKPAMQNRPRRRPVKFNEQHLVSLPELSARRKNASTSQSRPANSRLPRG
jgi:hypothetical protein